MISDFLLRAVLAMIVLSALVGPLGSVAVWRRMGYFGDAAAHAALLGVALSLMLGISIWIGTAAIGILMALYLGAMRSDEQSSDGLLGVISHGALALSLLLLSVFPQGRVNLESYLFGNVLTVSSLDVWLFAFASAGILFILFTRWRRLVFSTLSEEMAAAHGTNPKRESQIYTLLLALSVAMGIQILGALLMGAFLIIPAMAARRWAHSPESMALIASLIALLSGLGGLIASYYFDLQTAPAMVFAAVIVFFASQFQKN